ncbi:MAG: hypothetical protein ABSB41_12075 [Anaerolineales bacterium]|jgi:hypothetical protein
MHLTPFQPDRVTAALDLIFGLFSLGVAMLFAHLNKKQDSWKTSIWMWMFTLLAISSFLGVVVHGLDISDWSRYLLWQPLDLTLGSVLGFFVSGVICDLFGQAVSKKVLPYLIGLGFVFSLVIFLSHTTYRAFIPYEAAAFFFALGSYSWLTYKKTLAGAGLWVAGILITIIAAVVESIGQDNQPYFWQFDHNGVSHVLELFGIALIVAGLWKSLRPNR